MKEKLNKLVENKYLYGYDLKDDELTIEYGLSSVGNTERVIDLRNKDLEQAVLDSANELRADIESSLVDDDDFFGYSSQDELEDRIEEETEFLKELSGLIKEMN